jgi:hypothetical protein
MLLLTVKFAPPSLPSYDNKAGKGLSVYIG